MRTKFTTFLVITYRIEGTPAVNFWLLCGGARSVFYTYLKKVLSAVATIGGGASGAVAQVEWDFAQVKFSLPLDKMGQNNIIMHSKPIIS